MQGKITKVLNMKAPEILGMVEEAAGTRMFEDRKEKAFKAMSKKDKKVEEISLVSCRMPAIEAFRRRWMRPQSVC